VLNDLKKLKVKKWTYLVKDRKVWCELVQKTKATEVSSVRNRRRSVFSHVVFVTPCRLVGGYQLFGGNAASVFRMNYPINQKRATREEICAEGKWTSHVS
jgi:hypothetical protein